jgi:hypothetical protein
MASIKKFKKGERRVFVVDLTRLHALKNSNLGKIKIRVSDADFEGFHTVHDVADNTLYGYIRAEDSIMPDLFEHMSYDEKKQSVEWRGSIKDSARRTAARFHERKVRGW